MKRTCSMIGVAALVAGSIAFAQPATKQEKPKQPAAQPELPPGMSEADMKACIDAATPGAMHAHLAKGVGVWVGKTTCYMGPEVTTSECTSTCTAFLDGRFTKCEVTGDMPGMGPFTGFGIYGFDNVSQKFQSTWVDNMGTGMMTGTGELSADGKTLTWTYTYNCPIQKGPVTMREIEKWTSANSMSWEMFGPDPATGKEAKLMTIELTRKSGTASAGGTR